MTLSSNNKKYVWTGGILLVIILIAVGINQWRMQVQAGPKSEAQACALNILDTYLYNVPATTTKEMIARTLLTQYLNGYEDMPYCLASGIKDYTITSIAPAKEVGSDFTDQVTFDLLPISKTQTTWATSTSDMHWDGDWFRNREATLSVKHIVVSTSTDATSTYYLAF